MQINDNDIIQFFVDIAGWIAALVTTAFTGLAWYIWRGDRERLRIVEEKVNHAITKPEVEQIVKRVEADVNEQHKSIVGIIDKRHEELREDIRDLRNIMTGGWDGRNRRNKDV